MIEQRAIPFGPRMTEEHCKMLGSISILKIMEGIGHQLELTPAKPTLNGYVHIFRTWCQSMAQQKVDEVRTAIEDGVASGHTGVQDTARTLGLAQLTNLDGQSAAFVVDEHATLAFDFMVGRSPFYIPADIQPELERIIDFYVDKARQEYASVAPTADEMDHETPIVVRNAGSVAYEVMYI